VTTDIFCYNCFPASSNLVTRKKIDIRGLG
jgi:hypothetical protein